MAALGVLALAVFLGGNLASGGETSEPTPALDTVAAEQLEVGDCFSPASEDSDASFDQVQVVSCDEPHMYEVYHAFEYPIAGERYPSAAAFRANADACDEEAEDFIGAAPEDVDLKKLYLVPLEDQWAAGDRTITCALYDDDERPLTGSQRNAGDEN